MNTEQKSMAPAVHHIAVQTADFEQSVAWYCEFFGCETTWVLEKFSDLTVSRLPGITRLAELVVGGTRFHVFSRGVGLHRPPSKDTQQFQHVCLDASTAAALAAWRERWFAIYDSGRYAFAVEERATDIVTDDDGIQSFYCRDVNGLEYEFTYNPERALWGPVTSSRRSRSRTAGISAAIRTGSSR
jgi:catechol 2,3-dioxygenase-like lactoylglutathione lyase family enzyme